MGGMTKVGSRGVRKWVVMGLEGVGDLEFVGDLVEPLDDFAVEGDAVLTAFLLGFPFELAGVEYAVVAGGGWGLLEGSQVVVHHCLEFGCVGEGFDVEGGDKVGEGAASSSGPETAEG